MIDATSPCDLPAASRRVIAAFLKEHESPDDPINQYHIGSVYVLPSAVLRGIATAIFWIQKPKYTWRFSANLPEAERVAQEWFKTENLAWPGIQKPIMVA